MKFQNKLQKLRKNSKTSQEELAEMVGVSRQAVAKWESGQAYPDIENLIRLSEIFKITIDHMVREEDECSKGFLSNLEDNTIRMKEFLIHAKKNTYAAKAKECSSSRPYSHDFMLQEGDYRYIDTYLGGECFSGEEAVWVKELPRWAMNYSGRVIHENFNGDFLKEALLLVSDTMPYRGPGSYQKGDYSYHCKVDGDFSWFQGYEEIYCKAVKVYDCYFHGGIVK